MGKAGVGEIQGVVIRVFPLIRQWNDLDCDEISDDDSPQRGEHFYLVGFSIPRLDFIIQVEVCFS